MVSVPALATILYLEINVTVVVIVYYSSACMHMHGGGREPRSYKDVECGGGKNNKDSLLDVILCAL